MDGYTNGYSQDNSSTQRIDFSMRAMKADSNANSRARVKMSPKCMTHCYTSGHH